MITIFCWIFVIMRETLELDLMKAKGIINQKATLYVSGKYSSIFKECWLLALHPYPQIVGKIIKPFSKKNFL